MATLRLGLGLQKSCRLQMAFPILFLFTSSHRRLMLYTRLASPVAVCIAIRGIFKRLAWLANHNPNPNPNPNPTNDTHYTRIVTRLAVCIDISRTGIHFTYVCMYDKSSPVVSKQFVTVALGQVTVGHVFLLVTIRSKVQLSYRSSNDAKLTENPTYFAQNQQKVCARTNKTIDISINTCHAHSSGRQRRHLAIGRTLRNASPEGARCTGLTNERWPMQIYANEGRR